MKGNFKQIDSGEYSIPNTLQINKKESVHEENINDVSKTEERAGSML